MQRERSALDSFLEPIDLNQGSLPNNNNNTTSSMDHSSSWDNMLNPVDNQLPDYTGPTNAVDAAQCFSGWDRGESSSGTANNTQDGSFNDASKTNLGWASVFKACSNSDTRSENWPYETSNTQNYSSIHDSHRAIVPKLPHSLYKSSSSSHTETEQIPSFYPSSSNVGASFAGSSNSTTMMSENNDGPPFGTWGSSCKRKALENTSGQFYPGGSSTSNQPDRYIAPRNLSISPGPQNPSPGNHSEHLNPTTGGFYPSPSVRSNYGLNEPVPLDASRSTSSRNYGGYPRQLSRAPTLNPDSSSEMRSSMMSPPVNLNRRLMHVNEARGGMMHHSSYPWSGSFGSSLPGGGSSSGSFGSGARDEVSVRSSRRSNREYPEIRNTVHEQIDWSFSPGNSGNSSRNNSSSSPSSSANAWLPHQIQATSQQSHHHHHQRMTESAPWIQFHHHAESESGVSRGHFGLFPSAASSSSVDEVAAALGSSSRAQQLQLDQRSAAMLMDMPGDDANGWRALSAVEGRHRLIRQVLNAMRRGVHLQAEDYMLVDPFMNGFAELHDRHRDMRLDVDNMSYEELLALEDRIGNVSTGLTDEQIMGFMKHRKHEAIRALPNLEPCCVCQENYVTGDDVGILECGHEFHTNCIKQWLILKNLCPICKTAALKT
ncbi:hypothetical protein ABFS83_02G035700 [Erythranthe nasuta]